MNKPQFPYYFEWSKQYPHIAAVDLFGKNVANEVAVMAIDNRNGDLFFIRLDHLDIIDRKRLAQIVQSRDSARYALWDLMSQKTLPNGVNALEFFQQFVMGRTLSGQILKPGQGQRGIAINSSEFGYKGPEAHGYTGAGASAPAAPAAPTPDHDVDYTEADDGEEEQPVPAPAAIKRKAGRPKKTS